jgi:hypothetical protein
MLARIVRNTDFTYLELLRINMNRFDRSNITLSCSPAGNSWWLIKHSLQRFGP